MIGTIEMVLPGGDALLVLYKCPHCCTGDMKIKMELRGTTKQQFVSAMTRDGSMSMHCGNCSKEFTLMADQGLMNMLRLL